MKIRSYRKIGSAI